VLLARLAVRYAIHENVAYGGLAAADTSVRSTAQAADAHAIIDLGSPVSQTVSACVIPGRGKRDSRDLPCP
jgi:hypothetical protein